MQYIFTAWKERYNTVTLYVGDTVEDNYSFYMLTKTSFPFMLMQFWSIMIQ